MSYSNELAKKKGGGSLFWNHYLEPGTGGGGSLFWNHFKPIPGVGGGSVFSGSNRSLKRAIGNQGENGTTPTQFPG